VKEKAGLLGNKRAISPVVATVILVAVTIVVAIAVAYWMGSIAGLYTRFEKIEITSGYATYDAEAYGASIAGWIVTINLKNSGSADATIEDVLINGKPMSVWTEADKAKVDPSGTQLPSSIPSGSTLTVKLLLRKSDPNVKVTPFTAGTTVEIRLHSAAGQDYPKTITLE